MVFNGVFGAGINVAYNVVTQVKIAKYLHAKLPSKDSTSNST